MYVVPTTDPEGSVLPVEIDEGRTYAVVTMPERDDENPRRYPGTGRRGVLSALATMLRDNTVLGYYEAFLDGDYQTFVILQRAEQLEVLQEAYFDALENSQATLRRGEEVGAEQTETRRHLMMLTMQAASSLAAAHQVSNAGLLLAAVAAQVEEKTFDPDRLLAAEVELPDEELRELVAHAAPLTFGEFVADFAYCLSTPPPMEIPDKVHLVYRIEAE